MRDKKSCIVHQTVLLLLIVSQKFTAWMPMGADGELLADNTSVKPPNHA